MEFQKCSKCKKEKELNEDNFELKGTIYTKNCILCLNHNRKDREKRKEIKVCCLVCKIELFKHNLKGHCETKTHLNNLNGIKKETKKKIIKTKKEIKLPIKCIYKIYCLDDKIKQMYIGKTNNFEGRVRGHYNTCNNPNNRDYNTKIYKFIRENGGWENWKIEIIQECEEEDIDKLELYYYDKFNHDLNCHKPSLYNKLKNSVLYIIQCKDKNIKECYIGSTSNFSYRKNAHKNSCNNSNCKGHNTKLYQFIRENGNWKNWGMIILKKIECNSLIDLIKQEQEAIDNCEYPLLNDGTAYISFEDKRKNKKIYDQKYKKNYNDKLKDDRIICKFCNSEMRKDKFKRHCKEAKKHQINVNKFTDDINNIIKLLKEI